MRAGPAREDSTGQSRTFDQDVESLSHMVDEETAGHVLWHYRSATSANAIEPGSFTKKLMSAIAAADPGNRSKLGLGFLDYVIAQDLIERDPKGLEMLEALAARAGR